MKKIVSLLFPILVGFLLVFISFPVYGGDLNYLIQKISIDWDIPLLAIQILCSLFLAFLLTILFNLLKKIAIWLAIIVILASFAFPSFFSNLQIMSDDTKNEIERIVELKNNLN